MAAAVCRFHIQPASFGIQGTATSAINCRDDAEQREHTVHTGLFAFWIEFRSGGRKGTKVFVRTASDERNEMVKKKKKRVLFSSFKLLLLRLNSFTSVKGSQVFSRGH